MNLPPSSVFPKSYWTMPLFFLPGLLTTTSPNRISCLSLGIPPPTPTIIFVLIEEKLYPICDATTAALWVPIRPYGRQAMTTLWLPIRPREYELWSEGCWGNGPWRSSNIATAAAPSIGRAHIHPTVYSPCDRVRIVNRANTNFWPFWRLSEIRLEDQ